MQTLHNGINYFSPVIEKLINDFNDGNFGDWPSVILGQTIQVNVISLYKLLPTPNNHEEIIDTRSIASILRNIIDSHDVISMMLNNVSSEEFYLNRQILGYYISGKYFQIQTAIDPSKAEKFYHKSKNKYWENIKNSPLYDKNKMAKIKSGESIFYKTRQERLIEACPQNYEFISGIISELSAIVHSIPPALWFSTTAEVYANTEKSREKLAIWVRMVNYFYAKSLDKIFTFSNIQKDGKITQFIMMHNEIFQ